MNIVELSIKRPVMMTMVLAFLIVLGLFSYGRIPVDMLPKIDFPMVTIVTVYPGASPKNIETLVSQKIEDAVSSINGIRELKSDSYEGFSNVLIRFEDDIDVDTAAADVREKVAAIRSNLPDDAKEPVILKLDINALPILSLAIGGNRPVESTYAIAKDFVRDEIRRVDGVADLDFIGAREREITVQIDQGIAKAFQISPISLAGLIAQKSLNIPSGHITQTRKEYTIRMDGEFASVREIRELPIPTSGGKTYTLGDIAQVTDEYEEFRQAVRLNGRPCIAMIIKKRSDANSVRTATAVMKRLEELKSKLPQDIEFTAVRNRATFIVDSVNDLNGNLIMGVIITSIVLFLFLHSLKATFVSVLSIPISIVATYTLIYAFGFSLNMMSLMALAISVGILVNNAIVVLENIYVHLQKGKQSPKEAAVTGTNEILVAVAGCTLTNVLVFTPIAFMEGMVGRFFYEFGMTVTFATFVSLLVAFTLTPMCAGFFLSSADADPERKNQFGRWWDRMFTQLAADYRSLLNITLHHKLLTVLTCGVLFGSTLFLAPYIGFEFVTEPDQKEFDITVKLPPGSSLDSTNRALSKIETVLRDRPEVRFVFTKLGKTESLVGGSTTGTHLGEISVRLHDTITISTDRFIAGITPEVARIPDVELSMKKTGLLGTTESPIVIDILGDDLAVLQRIEQRMLEIVRRTPGTLDVLSSLQTGKPEVRIIPRREELARHGLTEAFLAMSLRASFEGDTTTKYREGDDEYDIRIKLDQRVRRDVSEVEKLLIISPQGTAIPLTAVARIEETTGPAQINRKSRTKLIQITANIAGRSLGEIVQDIRRDMASIDLPLGYSITFAGAVERMQESFTSLLTSLALAVIFTYMLLAALLESFIHPFTILLSFPLAFAGIFLGLFLTGQTLSIFSLMAVVMLVGIVVNNGILLIEEYKLRRENGFGLFETILEGSPAKLRPIVMTTIASVSSMIPLALGSGAGGEMRAAMATISIGGLLVSGLLSLVMIPLVYHLVEQRLRPDSPSAAP